MQALGVDIPPSLMLLYAKYLNEVLHDKDQAEEVLEKIKSFYIMNIDRSKITNNINDFANESTGLVSVSGEDVAFGRVIALNMSASKIFGYSKSELVNRKVNVIMPNLYS